MHSDDDLVELARLGNHDAFCALLERHRLVALRVGYTIAGGDAEDAVQEAMVKAFRHLERFRTGSPFRPWLLAIVANEARNRRRAQRRHTTLELRVRESDAPSLASLGGSAEDAAVARDQRSRLLAAVTALPDRDREIVALRYFAGLSEAETATALECPAGTVKSRLSRALGRLRIALAEEVRS